MLKKILFFVFVVFSFSLFSCTKKNEIVFDESEPLALAPDVEWALICEPYAAFRKTADWSAEVISHCRKGDIFMLKGTLISNDKENWYYFDQGWLPESVLLVYSNYFKAKAAKEMQK